MRELSDIVADFDVLTLASREEVERRERRELRAKRLEPMRDAITAEDMEALVSETVAETHALKWALGWLRVARGEAAAKDQRPVRFLVLQGQPGRGKTVAAGAVLAELGGLYMSMPDVVALASSKHWVDAERFEAFRAARCVVVDDVGAETCDPKASADVIWRLVNTRQGGRHFTVFTTNLAVPEFMARAGERGGDRIQHQGVIATVKGADLRRKAGA